MVSNPAKPTSEGVVYPIHLLDNAEQYRNLFMSYIFRFNSVLDGQKLADSLSTLLETDDWEKLGGRFRFNDQGKLEVYVADPPVSRVAFTQQNVDAKIDDKNAELGNRLPILSGQGTTVQKLSSDLRAFSGVPKTPASMQQMIDQDAPLLSLHVTSFTDATVIGISWPHPLMDALGLQALLRNWSLVVNGRPDQVQQLAGASTDLLQAALEKENSPKEPLLIEKISIGALGLIRLLCRLIWIKLWSPGFEERTMILPQEGLDKLCARARSDLETQSNGNEEKPFVSEGDVLSAWGAQILGASQPSPCPVTVASFINLRFRLATLKENTGTFVQNLLQFIYVSLDPSDTSESLGSVALKYRRQLMEQSTTPQLLSYLRMQLEHVRTKGKLRLVFGDPRAMMLTVNNLTKVDFFRNIDFSGAVVGEADAASKSQNPPGTIVYYHPLVLNEPAVLTSHLRILGKDHSGRVLMTGTFPPRTWDKIVEQLDLLK